MNEKTHAVRLALMLTVLVMVLFVVAVNHFVDSGTQAQEAAVLRAYAR